MSMRLTIAIPTYNFGRFIGETLDAFLDDLPEGVEVLVVDGASTDDTEAVVGSRQTRCPTLRYVRLPVRGGIDADVAKAIDLSRGRYVWTFSADDVAMKGAVRDVLALLADEPDVLIVAHAGCTVDMTLVTERYPVIDHGDLDIRILDASDRDRFLQRAVTSEAWFSFLSGLVIRRETWAEAAVPDGFFIGSCWGHAARLLATMRDRGLHVRIRSEPLLFRRGDNDSFLIRGLVARYALAIEGWHAIFAAIFGESAPELDHLRRVMRNEFGLNAFLAAKLSHGASIAERDWLRRQFDMIYGKSPRHRAYRALLWHLPPPAIRTLAGAKGAWTRLRR